MSFNVAMLKAMQAEGLDFDAAIRVLEAGEKKADRTNAERQARYRSKRKSNAVTVTPVPPNDIYSNPEELPQDANASLPQGAKKSVSAVWPCPDQVPIQTWRDFLASPKRRKAGMNETAYAGICKALKSLAEHGYPPGPALALAVERGWTTIKLEWVKNDGQQQSNSLGRHQSSDGLSPTTRAAARVFGTAPARQPGTVS